MSQLIYLSDVRLSFPHLTEPQVSKNQQTGKERSTYNADFIMPKDHPGLAQFMQRYAAMAQERWKENAQYFTRSRSRDWTRLQHHLVH